MAQPLSQDEQDDIVSRIGVGLETMDYDEIEALRDQLDADHKSQVDDSIREFADNAIGDEHWDSKPGERVLVALARAPWDGVTLHAALVGRGEAERLHGTLDLARHDGGARLAGDGPAVGVWRLG